jgi:hypothetical protein
MGFFDRFRKPRAPGEPETSPAEGAAPGPTDDREPVPDLVVIVREGMSAPSDEDMRGVLGRSAPELGELPRRAFAQPRWWQREDWLESGMRGIATALQHDHRIDPCKTTWRIVADERGAKVGIVRLFR